MLNKITARFHRDMQSFHARRMGLRREARAMSLLHHSSLHPWREGEKRCRIVIVRAVFDEINTLTDIGANLLGDPIGWEPHQVPSYILRPDRIDPVDRHGTRYLRRF